MKNIIQIMLLSKAQSSIRETYLALAHNTALTITLSDDEKRYITGIIKRLKRISDDMINNKLPNYDDEETIRCSFCGALLNDETTYYCTDNTDIEDIPLCSHCRDIINKYPDFL